MGEERANKAAGDLGQDIGACHPPGQIAFCREAQGHRGVKMGTGDGCENGDKDNEDSAGWQGISQQSQRLIVGQGLGHNA